MPDSIPLVRPYLPPWEEIEPDLRAMYDSGRLTNFGPFSRKLEEEAARLLGVSYVATAVNATSALTMIFDTLPRGSEVILPSFTFIATAAAVTAAGMIPVFADIDAETLNVAPRSVEERITSRTRAICAVHAFGVPCHIEALTEIARAHDLLLVFDAAHAFGSKHGSKWIGGFGDVEVFSVSATKVVPAGEGGLVATNREDLHRAILDRRNYGLTSDGSGDCRNQGWNSKMTEANAILALHEMRSIEWRVARRNEIARRYREALRDVVLQRVPQDDLSTYKDFTIQVEDRGKLRADLRARRIETAPYFWPPIHHMTKYKPFVKYKQSLAVTERVSEQILSLPLYEGIEDADVDRVIDAVLSSRAARRASSATSRIHHPRRPVRAPMSRTSGSGA